MADLFKRASSSPQLIPDGDWILCIPPSEQNSFSPPPRPDASVSFSEKAIQTIGYELEEWLMER